MFINLNRVAADVSRRWIWIAFQQKEISREFALAVTIHLIRTIALTPALSPGERETFSRVSHRSLISDFFQRGKCEFPLLGERVRVRRAHLPTA
jgi:hypothetical protein